MLRRFSPVPLTSESRVPSEILHLEKSIAKQRERLDKYIDLCADGIITKQELMERRKGLDNQIADLQSQYESVEQEDELL